MKKLFVSAALAATVLVTPAFAQDGVLSQTSSQADVDVTAVIPRMVRISGLEDLTLNVTAASLSDASGAQNLGQKFCVYSNDTLQGLYKLAVNGQAGDQLNTGEAKYSLSGPENQTLSFALWTSDQANNVYIGGTRSPGVAKNGSTTANGQPRTTTTNCNGNDNASMNVRFTNARLLAAVAGSYTGTLTFVVSPI
jgi:hypothetical protein